MFPSSGIGGTRIDKSEPCQECWKRDGRRVSLLAGSACVAANCTRRSSGLPLRAAACALREAPACGLRDDILEEVWGWCVVRLDAATTSISLLPTSFSAAYMFAKDACNESVLLLLTPLPPAVMSGAVRVAACLLLVRRASCFSPVAAVVALSAALPPPLFPPQ